MISSWDPGSATTVDPITFEVLRNAFAAVCNEMALVVAKTAYSTPVNEGRDFAGTVYDRHGKLVGQGEMDQPVFVGLTHLTVPEVIRAVGLESMEPGDIYAINDPYVASTHCNDIHLIRPVFFERQLVGFTSSTAHWSDVGGMVAGSLNYAARTHFEEGMRIPAITLYKRGVRNDDVVSLLLANMRQSWERLGDLNAQVAAVTVGDDRLQALIRKHGLETVLATMAEVQNHAERLARAAFANLPDGVYAAQDQVDQDVASGEPVTVRLKLTIEGDHAIFNLTESDDAVASGINCTIAGTTSAVFIAMASILPPMPINAGVMRAIEIKARRGSVVWAQPPSGVSAMAITTMDCILACVILALGRALPSRAVGVQSAIGNTTFAGHDARPGFDAPFINYIWSFGGLGGGADHDGPNSQSSPYSASLTTIPCELQERRYPVLFRRYMLLPDSGGPGRRRGGLALDQLIEPLHVGSLSNITGREQVGPAGVFGGARGRTSRLLVNVGTEQERDLGTFAVNVPVRLGDVLSFWSNGGGGYGDPLERPLDKVIEDIRDDYVSIEAARAQYGVVVQEVDHRASHFAVDHVSTVRARKEMHAARAGNEHWR